MWTLFNLVQWKPFTFKEAQIYSWIPTSYPAVYWTCSSKSKDWSCYVSTMIFLLTKHNFYLFTMVKNVYCLLWLKKDRTTFLITSLLLNWFILQTVVDTLLQFLKQRIRKWTKTKPIKTNLNRYCKMSCCAHYFTWF